MLNWRGVGHLIACAARFWSSDNASTTGAALAFFCAFSMAPLLVILLAIAGSVLGEQTAYSQLQAQLQGLFGPATAKTVMGAVEASKHAQGWIATLISIVTLLIGASTVLNALQTALDQIWQSSQIAPGGWRGIVRSRLLSFGFVLTLAFLLLISLTISTALSNIRTGLAHRHAALVGVLGIAGFAISLVVVTSLFTLIYRYMPARRLPWSVVLVGGLLTAVLFDLGRWVVSVYLAYSTQPSAFGAAASFAALLLWLYYTAQIFLFGAEFTACLAGVRDHAPENEASAASHSAPSAVAGRSSTSSA
jgi:membrane protein